MRSVARCALAAALVISLVGLSPGALSAQQVAPSENLVARCDLPVVDLFNPLPGDVLQPGSYLISGLALDPMASASTSGIDQVSFFLGDRDQGGLQIGSVVPSSGLRQADFSVTVTLPSGSPGVAQLEAFAHSALTGKETEVAMPITVADGSSNASQSAAGDAINTNPGALPDTCSQDDLLPQPTVAPSATATLVPSVANSLPLAKPATAPPTPLFAEIVGTVTACTGGVEQPVSMVTVKVQGTSATGITDLNGVFAVMQVPAPATYSISVSDGGQTATRMYVPVAPGETIDIGPLQLGADVTSGCGEGLPPNN
jgi:hypothetical protein